MIHSIQAGVVSMLLGALLTALTPANAAAPFDSMLYFNPDIVPEETHSQFHKLRYIGADRSWGWDFRQEGDAWRQFSAHLYEVQFHDSPPLVFQVNREFGTPATAQFQAYRYAAEVGRIPPPLRAGFKTVSIHRGNVGFAASADDFPIHTTYAEQLARNDYLGEYLLYNAVRASLNPSITTSDGWKAAQQADGRYVSEEARSEPALWDVAESFLAYLAAVHRADHIGTDNVAAILEAIPHRIAYFKGLHLNLRPLIYENVIDERLKGFFLRDDMPGQGLAIDVDVRNQVLDAIWHTVSPDTGELVWYSMFGEIRGDRTEEMLIQRNAGARFVESAPIRQTRVGVATLLLIDCDTVELEYNLHAHQRTGILRLSRSLGSPEACLLAD